MAVMTNNGSQGNALADRLNHLFETVHPPYTAREVADAINAQAGAEIISAAYLSQMQTGHGGDPSHSHLLAIARFFRVDIGYFCNEVAEDIARRVQGLSPASLAAVRAVIENTRRLEGLDHLRVP